RRLRRDPGPDAFDLTTFDRDGRAQLGLDQLLVDERDRADVVVPELGDELRVDELAHVPILRRHDLKDQEGDQADEDPEGKRPRETSPAPTPALAVAITFRHSLILRHSRRPRDSR